MGQSYQVRLPRNLTLYIGNEETLLDRATRNSTELLLAPVELHRRNIQRRLRERRLPKDGFEITSVAELGASLLERAGRDVSNIDRIDRLSMMRSLLADGERSLTGPTVPPDPQEAEQVRTEVENVTGFHPARHAQLREVTNELASPIDADAAELVDTAVEVERRLRNRTEKAVSEVEHVRGATRTLMETDGDLWRIAYPEVERVSLVGVSSVPATHVDLLHALLETTSVSVNLYFRRGTGPYLAERFTDLLDVPAPGTVVFES